MLSVLKRVLQLLLNKFFSKMTTKQCFLKFFVVCVRRKFGVCALFWKWLIFVIFVQQPTYNNMSVRSKAMAPPVWHEILIHGVNFFCDSLFLFKLTLVETKFFTEKILPKYPCSTSENLKLWPLNWVFISEKFVQVETTHVFPINTEWAVGVIVWLQCVVPEWWDIFPSKILFESVATSATINHSNDHKWEISAIDGFVSQPIMHFIGWAVESVNCNQEASFWHRMTRHTWSSLSSLGSDDKYLELVEFALSKSKRWHKKLVTGFTKKRDDEGSYNIVSRWVTERCALDIGVGQGGAQGVRAPLN